MKFNWDGFTEEDFVKYCATIDKAGRRSIYRLYLSF